MTATAPSEAELFEREPPSDIPAEQAVLGSMLLSKEAIGAVVEAVREEDFYRPAHQILYAAMVDMFGRGDHVDPITLFDYLRTKGDNLTARVGGAPYLHTLMEAVTAPAAASHYARIVRSQAVLRRQVEWGMRVAQRAYAQEGDADELLNLAMAEMSSIAGTAASDDYQPLSEIITPTLDMIEAIGNRSGEIVGVPTGFADFDSLTTGLLPGQFIVVAGRPAMGKSTWGLDVLRSASIRHGLASVIFSLEMDRKEIVMRLLSAEARVALHHIRAGTMSDDDWTRMARRMTEIAQAPLFIDDSPNMSMTQIRAKAARLKQRHGLRLIVVDYLQLMTSPGKTESRQQEVSELSRQLKLLAKELEVPVIGISQLNRGPEQRTDKRPMVSDLRESGSIEQDADMVILLYREDAYDKESPRAGEAELIVAKHRNGPTTTVTVAFQGHYSRFVDMATP